ncbi:MAG: hypothetical protein AD073_000308 [Mycoplasmataceae bacterium]|nr:MAG: hypothetical protein AD073_000308 [Mycoplasmataceae bacterium]
MKNNEANRKFRYLAKPRKSNFYSEVKERIKECSEKYKLLGLDNPKAFIKLEKSDFAAFITYIWPFANSSETSFLLTDFIIWTFVYDDWFEKNSLESFKEINRQIFNVMDNKDFSNRDNPYVALFHEFFQAFQKEASIDCERRFINSMKKCLLAAEEEMLAKQKGSFNNIDHYIKIRRFAGAVIPSFNLLELTRDIDSSLISISEEKLNQLLEIASDQVCYFNDFFSYEREKVSGDIANLVINYEIHNNYSNKKALEFSFNLIELRTNQFGEIYQTIDPIKEKDLKEYADGIIDWMSGHMEWYNHTKRYSEKIFLNKEELVCKVENLIVNSYNNIC